MLYDRIAPSLSLSGFIDCYWVVENEDSQAIQQKIIPDGYPEIIFHYGDVYRINISGEWRIQSRKLLAGQIRNHFLLENTGISGMIGVKLKPAGIAQLFGIPMSELNDKVVPLDSILQSEFEKVSELLLSKTSYKKKATLLDTFFSELVPAISENDLLTNKCLDLIFSKNGLISISELTEEISVNERKLERLFKKSIGLSPKFYSRIIRFNYIFQLVQDQTMSWSEIAQLSGFYDQSHFISNFQEFSGEDPTKYFFEDENFANFFLKKPTQH